MHKSQGDKNEQNTMLNKNCRIWTMNEAVAVLPDGNQTEHVKVEARNKTAESVWQSLVATVYKFNNSMPNYNY